MIRSIFEIALSLGIILGSGHFAMKTAHDTIGDLAFSKIRKGLTPTSKLNDMLWDKK